jgi:hypothetical protein
MGAISYHYGDFFNSFTIGVAMALQLKDFACLVWFIGQSYSLVKDKGANLNTFTTTITNIVSCVPLVLLQPYVVICYGHAMFKCYQYATNDLKVFNGMKEVSI